MRARFLSNLLAGGWVALLQVVVVPLYIRFLGMEAYGLIGLYSSLQAWLSVMDLGMTPTLTRELARGTALSVTSQAMAPRDLLKTLERVTAFISSGFFLGMVLASGPIAGRWLRVTHLPISTVALSLVLMAAVVAARWMTGLYRGGLMGLQHQVSMNVLGTFFGTLRVAGVLPLLVFVSPSVLGFFFFQVGVVFVETAVTRFYLKSRLPVSSTRACFSWPLLGRLRRFAGGMTLVTLLGTLFSQFDKLFLSKTLPLSDFGVYAFAGVMATSLHVPTLAVAGTYAPRFNQLVALQDDASLKKIYHEGTRLLSVLLLSVAALLMVFADVVVLLWSGNPAFSSAVPPLLVPLTLGTLLNCLMNMPYQLQVSHGWTRLSIVSSAFSIVGMAVALFWMVPLFGARGAALGWAGVNILQFFVAVPWMHRRIFRGEFFSWFFSNVGKQALVAFVLAIFFREATHVLGLTHTKAMWALLPFFGAVLLVGMAGVSGFRPFLHSLGRSWKSRTVLP